MKFKRIIIPAVLAASFGLAACSGGGDNASGGQGGDASPSNSMSSAAVGSGGSVSGKLAGGGSSAQEVAQGAWRKGFAQANPDAQLSYESVGSGTGRENFINGGYQYAGTDDAMKPDELSAAEKTCGSPVVEIPVYISPIDVTYNLSGVDNLQLSPKTVANIFNGKITSWNDPAIKADNPDAKLPSTKITAVHRSDSSGTTGNFTDFLYKASGGAWKTEGSSDWPTKTGESGAQNPGVLNAVKNGDGTIGYNDDSVVVGSGVSVAKIKVGNSYNKPTADGAAAALSASKLVHGTPDSVMQYDLNRTSTDPSTYPIFMASYEVACQKYSDANTGKIVKAYLAYISSSDGQKAAQANAYSAPLPDAIASKEADIIAGIS